MPKVSHPPGLIAPHCSSGRPHTNGTRASQQVRQRTRGIPSCCNITGVTTQSPVLQDNTVFTAKRGFGRHSPHHSHGTSTIPSHSTVATHTGPQSRAQFSPMRGFQWTLQRWSATSGHPCLTSNTTVGRRGGGLQSSVVHAAWSPPTLDVPPQTPSPAFDVTGSRCQGTAIIWWALKPRAGGVKTKNTSQH